MTKWQAALAFVFLIAAGFFWLVRPVDESAGSPAVATPAAHSLAATELGAPPARLQDVLADTSPPSGAVRGERNVRQRGDRDGVTLDDGPLSPLGIPEAGLLSKPEKPQKKVGNRARSWWDDVERWRYAEEARPDLRGRDFGDADLGFVDLANADLRRADLEDANLNRANLSGANLQEAVIKRTYLYGTVMRNAVLRGTEIGPANISAADLQEADLRDLRIGCRNCSTQSLLMSSNFNGADLRRAHLGASNIHRSAFDGADLRGANLAETEGVPRSLRGALYNRHTRLPEHIDPEKWGMIYVPDDAAT